MTRYKEIRARRFVLVDQEGRERAALAADGTTGTTSLTMIGDNDVITLELTTLPGGAAVIMRDAYENERVLISTGHQGALVNLLDLGGNLAVTLSVGPGPERSIGLFLDGSTAVWGKQVTGIGEDEKVDDLGES